MTLTAYKRKWFEEVYRELRGQGLTDTAIAARMGYSRSYFSQVKAAENIGDEFIDKMVVTFRKKFIPAPGPAIKDEKGASEELRALNEMRAEIREEFRLFRHLMTAILEEKKP